MIKKILLLILILTLAGCSEKINHEETIINSTDNIEKTQNNISYNEEPCKITHNSTMKPTTDKDVMSKSEYYSCLDEEDNSINFMVYKSERIDSDTILSEIIVFYGSYQSVKTTEIDGRKIFVQENNNDRNYFWKSDDNSYIITLEKKGTKKEIKDGYRTIILEENPLIIHEKIKEEFIKGIIKKYPSTIIKEKEYYEKLYFDKVK